MAVEPEKASTAVGGRRWVASVAVLAMATAWLVDGPDDAIHDAVARGRPFPAPDLDLAVVTAGDLGRAPRGWWRLAGDGRVMSRGLRGHPVVISFWAPECRPCRAEARTLEQVWQEADADVLVLGVSTAPSWARTRDLIHALGLSFPQAHDPTGEAAQRRGVDGVPEMFSLARDGHIVGHIVGAATAAHVREGVRAALTGRPSGLRTGGARDRL